MRVLRLYLLVLMLPLLVLLTLKTFRDLRILNIAAAAVALGNVIALGLTIRVPKGGKPAPRRWFSVSPSVVAMASMALLAGWLWFRMPPGEGSGPAGPAVSVEPFSKAWQEGPVVLLTLGDSVSVGYGARDGHGYVDLLTKNVDEVHPDMKGRELKAVFPALTVVKKAVNYTISTEHEGVLKLLPAFPTDTFGVVCMTTGGNDLIHNYGRGKPHEGALYGATHEQAKPWIANYAARLDRMMLMIKEKFPGGCAVFLANIYDPTDDIGDIENAGPMGWLPPWPEARPIHGDFNKTIAACAEKHEHVHLVDMYSVMLGHGIHCTDPFNKHFNTADTGYWYFINLEDPNERGYDAIRRVFLNKMVEVFVAREP
ncbi:MAG: SGNH/GDSL hydrolase family protein [Planctomycetes bacterium]|nr:SGNH/GDSL hydrolase family protein [Planctomycetota bacterium]